MVVQELRVRYQRSILGFVWSLLNPILMMVILSWVFSHIMKSVENYSLFLFAGMVPWSFFSISLNDCAFAIIQNEGLDPEDLSAQAGLSAGAGIDLPGHLCPLAGCACFCFCGRWVPGLHSSLLFLPVAIALLAMFTLGLGLIVATLNTFYRDCGHLIARGAAGLVLCDPDPLSDRTVRDRRSGGFVSIRRSTSSSSFTTSCTRGAGPGSAWWQLPL